MTDAADTPESSGRPERQNSLVFRVDRSNPRKSATIEPAAAE